MVDGGAAAAGAAGAGFGSASFGAAGAFLLVGLLAALATQAAAAKDDKKKKKERPAYALLGGTLFDENGRRVPGIEIVVREKDGKRRWKAASDTSGEFAVHLPAGAAVYIVEAVLPKQAAGYVVDSVEVTFSGEERQDISLRVRRVEKATGDKD